MCVRRSQRPTRVTRLSPGRDQQAPVRLSASGVIVRSL